MTQHCTIFGWLCDRNCVDGFCARQDERNQTVGAAVEPWRWLESTVRLQREAYLVDTTSLEGDALADSLMANHSALVVELGEFMAEVGWKPWGSHRGWVNRDKAVGELIDVGHFLANLAVSLGVTDEEWERLYQAKQERNAARQREGYTGAIGGAEHDAQHVEE